MEGERWRGREVEEKGGRKKREGGVKVRAEGVEREGNRRGDILD